jgi:hypothetical protein
MSNNENDADLKKALAFLLEKEMKDYSLDKKKEFLLKKVSPEVVEKAISLYPLIENNISQTLDEYKKDTSTGRGYFDSFFDLGIISTVLLSTLGINYLIDLNRNKKSDLFYKDIERRIAEELSKTTQEMKSEIYNELQGFVRKDQVSDTISEHLETFTKQKGLNLNLSSKTMKENISSMKTEIGNLDHKVKELGVKMENNNLLFKQEMLKELNDLIAENNKKLLMQIIENQNKLLLTLGNKTTEVKDAIETSPLINKPSDIGLVKLTSTVIEDNEEQNFENFNDALQAVVSSINTEKDVKTFLKGLNVLSL